MQTIQLSPSGNIIGIVSIFGNKIHLYYTQTGKLKECILLSPYILTIDKLLFSKKANYIMTIRCDKKFSVYKDSNVMLEEMDEKNTGIFGFFRRVSINRDLKETHAFSEYKGDLLFIDFDGNVNKDIIIINGKGEFLKYHFKKNSCGHLTPIISFQWE